MMGLDNPVHILFLLVLMLVVFGAKRLPEMGRSLGSGMRGFKESLSGEIGHGEVAPRLSENPVTRATALADERAEALAGAPERQP